MKRTLCSICIGSLALTLTAWGQPINDTRPERAKAHRTANVRATKPANTGGMRDAHRYTATAPSRQRTYTPPRTNRNALANQDARMHASRQRNFSSNRDFRARSDVAVNRDRSFAVNRARNVEVKRNRSAAEFRARNDFATNRERNVAVNRTRNFEVNRDRNTAEFRARNELAVTRNRNFAFNRRSNVATNNNFRSAAFRGRQYAAFRNYHREWHDRGWWRSHYNRIIFVNGGWYYWNAGYWFPAWGYAPSAYYAFDGPIYAYNGLAPDQVIVDVQSQLQRDGYYDGPIDGVLGPMTREAIAAFQADHGLAVTSAIDEPTLATLGIA
jgi:putative peptidoglycan binding protein